ncbi:hypothetical protein ACQJBY_000850 [Aegilops geniculata]
MAGIRRRLKVRPGRLNPTQQRVEDSGCSWRGHGSGANRRCRVDDAANHGSNGLTKEYRGRRGPGGSRPRPHTADNCRFTETHAKQRNQALQNNCRLTEMRLGRAVAGLARGRFVRTGGDRSGDSDQRPTGVQTAVSQV